LNYLALPLKTINLSYERIINNSLSAQIQYFCVIGNVGAPSTDFYIFRSFLWNSTCYHWFGLTTEIRIYPKVKAPQGLFIAPFLHYQHYLIMESPDEANGEEQGSAYVGKIGLGLCMGRQWLIKNHLSFDLYGGPGINFITGTGAVLENPVI